MGLMVISLSASYDVDKSSTDKIVELGIRTGTGKQSTFYGN